jgi:hypothetical protein
MYILFWIIFTGQGVATQQGVTSGTREFSSIESCEKVKKNIMSTRAYLYTSTYNHVECYKK